MTYSEENDAVTEVTEPNPSDKLYTNDFISAIFRFLTALLKLITKAMLIKK